jgi:hypothetical protein
MPDAPPHDPPLPPLHDLSGQPNTHAR